MPGYVVYIVGCPIIVYLVFLIVTKTRALNKRIQEYFAEEAVGSKDPYADMLALAQVEEALQQQRKLQKESKALLSGGKQPPPSAP